MEDTITSSENTVEIEVPNELVNGKSMKVNDILGRHVGGSHVNFEILAPNPDKTGKMKVIDIHIYLEDF